MGSVHAARAASCLPQKPLELYIPAPRDPATHADSASNPHRPPGVLDKLLPPNRARAGTSKGGGSFPSVMWGSSARAAGCTALVFLPRFPADAAIWLDWQSKSGKTAHFEPGALVQPGIASTCVPSSISGVAEIASLHFGVHPVASVSSSSVTPLQGCWGFP